MIFKHNSAISFSCCWVFSASSRRNSSSCCRSLFPTLRRYTLTRASLWTRESGLLTACSWEDAVVLFSCGLVATFVSTECFSAFLHFIKCHYHLSHPFYYIHRYLKLRRFPLHPSSTSLFSSPSCEKKSLNDVSAVFEQNSAIPSLVSPKMLLKIWNHVGPCAPAKPESFFYFSLNFLHSSFTNSFGVFLCLGWVIDCLSVTFHLKFWKVLS